MRQCGTALSMPQNYDKWFGNAHKQATDRPTTTATAAAANHNNNSSWTEPQRRTEHILFLWCCFPCCCYCCYSCCCCSSRAGWRKSFRVEGNVISFFLSSVLVFVFFFPRRFPTDKTTASRTTLRKSLPKITELKRRAEGAAGWEGKTIATIASARCAQ